MHRCKLQTCTAAHAAAPAMTSCVNFPLCFSSLRVPLSSFTESKCSFKWFIPDTILQDVWGYVRYRYRRSDEHFVFSQYRRARIYIWASVVLTSYRRIWHRISKVTRGSRSNTCSNDECCCRLSWRIKRVPSLQHVRIDIPRVFWLIM